MNVRGIPSVQYTQTNQLEGLRRMQHARTWPKGTKVSTIIGDILERGGVPVQINYIPPQMNTHDQLREAIEANPCLVGRHRPAWLVGGGIACGVCGAYL
jgi:hypothetical protein